MRNTKIRALVFTFVIACSNSVAAQADSTHTFWDNWFVQFGADMTVQKPHGHAFKDALSKGTSFGVDVAVGKWFMFPTAECTFRSGERVFRSGERTFRSAEYK